MWKPFSLCPCFQQRFEYSINTFDYKNRENIVLKFKVRVKRRAIIFIVLHFIVATGGAEWIWKQEFGIAYQMHL